MYESCSTARKACGLKFKFDISQTWFFFLNEGKPVSPLEGAEIEQVVRLLRSLTHFRHSL